MAEAESGRARLLKEIETRRRGIEQYLDAKRPVSNRLTTISVISSCVAAALAAGPAVGGSGFADTVQNGLPIVQSSSVWRLLCFAAVAASIAAAISANLSKSSDLAERVAAAEAANSLLDGLRARMRFSRLPVAEAAQQYQEIIARIPWVSDPDEGAFRVRGRQGQAAAGASGPESRGDRPRTSWERPSSPARSPLSQSSDSLPDSSAAPRPSRAHRFAGRGAADTGRR